MYSSSLKHKELKRDEKTIQAYIKYPAILMVKKSGGRSYSAYAEFWSFFCLGFGASQYVYFVMFRKVIASKIFTNGNASHIRVPLNEGKKAESPSSEFHRTQLVYSSTNMTTFIEYVTNTLVFNLVTHV